MVTLCFHCGWKTCGGESEDPAGYKWELIALHAPDFGDDSRPDSVAFELRWTGDGTPIYEVRADMRIRGGAAATHEAFAAFVRSLYQDAIDSGWHLESVTCRPARAWAGQRYAE